MRITKASYEVRGEEITLEVLGDSRVELRVNGISYVRYIASDGECRVVADEALVSLFGTRTRGACSPWSADVPDEEICDFARILRGLP